MITPEIFILLLAIVIVVAILPEIRAAHRRARREWPPGIRLPGSRAASSSQLDDGRHA